MRQLLGPISGHRLLDDIVKQLLNEPAVDLGAARQELSQLPGADKLDQRLGNTLVRSGGIDCAVSFLGPKPSHGIILFEAETEWVNHPVTGLAVGRPSLQRDPLAGGHFGPRVFFERCHGDRRWPQRSAEQAADDEDTSVDRRGRLVVGEKRK